MVLLKSLMIVLQILSALGVIGLVLVQHGKGADMGAAFGSGSSGSLFGATGSSNFLSRSTGVLAAVFFACTLGLTYLGSAGRSGPSSAVGVMGGAAATTPAPVVASGAAGASVAPAVAGSASSGVAAVVSGPAAGSAPAAANTQDVPK